MSVIHDGEEAIAELPAFAAAACNAAISITAWFSTCNTFLDGSNVAVGVRVVDVEVVEGVLVVVGSCDVDGLGVGVGVGVGSGVGVGVGDVVGGGGGGVGEGVGVGEG